MPSFRLGGFEMQRALTTHGLKLRSASSMRDVVANYRPEISPLATPLPPLGGTLIQNDELPSDQHS